MDRTTIVLPQDIKFMAQRFALEHRISLSELIRTALLRTIKENPSKKQTKLDPFLEDKHYFTGITPNDLAQNHDNYLY